jgi:hypothetical protein
MAYLDMEEFIQMNTGNITSEYKVWSGVDDAFITYKAIPVAGQNGEGTWWWVADSNTPLDAPNGANRYIAPLQSFIARKTTSNMDVNAYFIYESSSMTTTANIQGSSYALRNDAKEKEIPSGVMYIKASQGKTSNTTVLINYPGASNSYTNDDSPKLFFDNADDKSHLSVYTLSSDGTPMAINLSGSLINAVVPLGIRTNMDGEVQFDFTGLERFGYKVTLMDGSDEIDLTATPVYKTTLQRTAAGFYEINDRFVLKFDNSGNSIDANPSSFVKVQSKTGEILVYSNDLIQFVEVYTISGVSVYKSKTSGYFHAIDVAPSQTYIVQVVTDKRSVMQKVIVK